MHAVSLLLLSVVSANTDSQNVLLYFTGDYCIHCRQMNPVVSRLQRSNAPIRKVDVERESSLARRYGITDIPAFVLVINGNVTERIVGPTSENRLKRMLAKIPRPASPNDPTHFVSQQNFPETPTRFRSDDTDIQLISDAPKKKPRFSLPFFGSNNKNRERQVDPPVRPNTGFSDDTVIRAKLGKRKPAVGVTQQSSPFASSVRIRIKDPQGISYGSGTVINSRPGHTLILTCGHLFRDLAGDSLIEVDLFEGKRSETFVGKVVRYDLEADVGLLSIPTESAIAYSRVAGIDTNLTPGERVVSIGCSSGDFPTKQQLRVTALNRYRGPENIECTGVPVQGRSGGGLFNASGEVIGVCVAADPRDRRGLYAGLKAVQKLLDRTNLAHLYRPTQDRYAQSRASTIPVADLIEKNSLQPNMAQATAETQWVVDHDQLAEMIAPEKRNQPQASTDGALVPASYSGTTEIPDFLKQGGEAEVICIIRPLDNPQAASRVVIINRASAKFVSSLQGELRNQPRPTMKSMKYPLKKSNPAPQRRMSDTTHRRVNQSRASSPLPTGPRRYRRSAESR
ncbi:MAG: trypsin-like peptidase domain-containing protein [Planctomycetes bacterium]|nr:trypsin-like peptidase domain-containing protein [Planctomycetota bacterium]